MARNGWKKGDWLVIDEESGVTTYASKVRRDWLGRYVTSRYADDEQPQDFAYPLDDPKTLPFILPPDTNFEISNTIAPFFGQTSVPNNIIGAATHLYTANGIGEMAVGSSFIVT